MNERMYDLVVIGSGMAGLATGLRANQLGLSVGVLEKAPKERRGGHTQFTESFRVPTADININAEFNVDNYTEADFYSDIMQVTNYWADSDLAKQVTSTAAETLEWLTEFGIDWEYQAPHPGYTAAGSGLTVSSSSRNSLTPSRRRAAIFTTTRRHARCGEMTVER